MDTEFAAASRSSHPEVVESVEARARQTRAFGDQMLELAKDHGLYPFDVLCNPIGRAYRLAAFASRNSPTIDSNWIVGDRGAEFYGSDVTVYEPAPESWLGREIAKGMDTTGFWEADVITEVDWHTPLSATQIYTVPVPGLPRYFVGETDDEGYNHEVTTLYFVHDGYAYAGHATQPGLFQEASLDFCSDEQLECTDGEECEWRDVDTSHPALVRCSKHDAEAAAADAKQAAGFVTFLWEPCDAKDARDRLHGGFSITY